MICCSYLLVSPESSDAETGGFLLCWVVILKKRNFSKTRFGLTGVVEPGEPRSSANRGYSFSIPQAILMIWIWERSDGKDSGIKEGAGMWGSLMKKSPRM